MAADSWLRTNNEQLVTTDYVIDELITLLERRGERRRGARARDACFGEGCAQLEFVTPTDFLKVWDVHDTFTDKRWSFTDCVSRVVMERLGVNSAFSFDQHFSQFGTVSVLPR